MLARRLRASLSAAEEGRKVISGPDEPSSLGVDGMGRAWGSDGALGGMGWTARVANVPPWIVLSQHIDPSARHDTY